MISAAVWSQTAKRKTMSVDFSLQNTSKGVSQLEDPSCPSSNEADMLCPWCKVSKYNRIFKAKNLVLKT